MTGNNNNQRKRTKTIYWIFTGLFSLFMLLSALSDLFEVAQARTIMSHLGFPPYLMRFMGAAKVLGLIVLLMPQFSKIKEWAYAGFVFNLVGGFYAHLCVFDPPGDLSRPLFFLLLLIVSYITYRRSVEAVCAFITPPVRNAG